MEQGRRQIDLIILRLSYASDVPKLIQLGDFHSQSCVNFAKEVVEARIARGLGGALKAFHIGAQGAWGTAQQQAALQLLQHIERVSTAPSLARAPLRRRLVPLQRQDRVERGHAANARRWRRALRGIDAWRKARRCGAAAATRAASERRWTWPFDLHEHSIRCCGFPIS